MNFKYLDADKMRIAHAGDSGRIFAGVQHPTEPKFVGVIKDVTSDCINAVINKVGVNEPHVVTENGKPAWEIVVKRIGTTQ